MAAYTRPAVEERSFYDASGRVIDYGTRWGGASPPEDTYSVVTHPERFAPLHRVAEALIDHLVTTYVVEVRDDLSVAADLRHPPADVVRAVRLLPADPDAAPLTVAFTSFPGVIVHAGLLHDFLYPDCGCDACDQTWDGEAAELEWQVLAVASGGYRERVRRQGELGVEYELRAAGGIERRGGRGRVEDYPEDLVRSAEEKLATLHDGWRPWPPRTPGTAEAEGALHDPREAGSAEGR